MDDKIPDPFLKMGESLRLTLNTGHIMASLILMFSYIDAMASLTMPDGQKEVRGRDFISWVETYMRSGSQQYQYCGIDLWGARCGLLHRYSPNSRHSDAGQCKKLVYSTRHDHLYNSAQENNIVVISANLIVTDFFGAMSNFLKDILSNPEVKARVDKRFKEFFHEHSRDTKPA